MTAEEWARIKDIFEAALNLPEEARQEYLRLASNGEPQIHETVVELVRNHQSVVEASRRIRFGASPTLTAGEMIAGRFRIIRFIAGGGIGEVYEAVDEQLKIRLALKTLRPALLSEPGALERFKREILIARSVSHENLCRVFDFIQHRPSGNSEVELPVVPCITMELLDGESLADLVRRERPLSVTEAKPLVYQVAQGLQILHDHGVIHRDLKPSNIMLTRRRDGGVRAVVMDFGLAKRQDSEGDLYESQTELQAGAPYFMAPELLRNAKPSVASDIYSLGLVIDELITRDRAFSAASLQDLYFAKLWERPADPSSRATGLPEQWRRGIQRCLESQPEQRFGSVLDIIHALELGVSIHEEAHSILLPELGSTAPHGGRISRRTLLVGGVALPVLGGAAVLLGMTFQRLDTSVEVFNIDNITNDKQYDYFCKGITNELMRSLLHLRGVRVLPVYATRENSSSKQIGRFSLDGLLEAQKGRVRLSMRLTDNHDGTLVWSEEFNRQAISNPIELESVIAQGSVSALERRILSKGDSSLGEPFALAAMPLRHLFATQSSAALPGPPTSSNAAFDLYMRGHTLLEELSPQSIEPATEYFLEAIKEDPNFALAYAAVADARIASMNYDVSPRGEALASARSYAEEAVHRDPSLAEARMVLGAIRQIDWDWPGARSSFEEALRLKPNLGRARRWFAGLILQFRRFDEAIAEMRHALEVDPYDRSGPPSFGLVLTLARKFNEAEAVLLAALSVRDMVLTRLNLAQLYGWLGHTSSAEKVDLYFAKAITQVNAAQGLIGRTPSEQAELPLTDAMFALFYSMMEDGKKAERFLRKSESAVETGTLSPVMLAKVYAARNDFKRAIELLDLAAEAHDRRLMYVNITPFFDALHGQPGFQNLLDRMGLISA